MARKVSAKTKTSAKAAPKVAARAVSSTPVRNSAIPKTAPAPLAAPKRAITHDVIAVRAYEISRSGTGGSDVDNWLRAERELRGV